ncbi:hypothetical protein A6770_08725 [Nostoc minutum NIES-26]|uniref:Uncharacterized protein n=1 Tax=Nostoc minutum NIES-26 TaxID=1844469 RepID=A0A367S0E2_9NOSO|nr:hypothetical protein [Dendronalium sp. ChiSLP03b]MDZ8209538.1 hypothetical protein [Dendronalium sp. ChiSLP03b]RCJ42278.1 hypothetical protein A6770_08725 [Nostoc minutum NIES-26]
MIPTSKPKLNSHPWCIIRQLPNMQRQVVARFHRRHDADAYFQILQRLLPSANHVIVFDSTVTEIPEEAEKSLLEQLV